MAERIYLAGRFSRRHEFKIVAETFEAAGHEVTSGWLHSEDHHLDLADGQPLASAAAKRDLSDVRRATVCIAFTERPEGPQGRGGRHVEVGAALAFGLRVIVVGEPEHIFHLLPGVDRVDSAEHAIAALSEAESLSAIAA